MHLSPSICRLSQQQQPISVPGLPLGTQEDSFLEEKVRQVQAILEDLVSHPNKIFYLIQYLHELPGDKVSMLHPESVVDETMQPDDPLHSKVSR